MAETIIRVPGKFKASEYGTPLADSSDLFDDVNEQAINDTIEVLNSNINSKVSKETGKGLSTNDYTTAEKDKLAGISAGAEVNQNAFTYVKVGSTTIAADSKNDTLELVAGSNVTLTPDATNDKITIAASGGGTPVDAYTKSESDAKYVQKDGNKGLSTNDYTTADANAVNTVIKDKAYSQANFSGLGRVFLQKNIQNNKNVLKQSMLSTENTVYIIQYDYEIAPDTVEYTKSISSSQSMTDGGTTYFYTELVLTKGDIVDKGSNNQEVLFYNSTGDTWARSEGPSITAPSDNYKVRVAAVAYAAQQVTYTIVYNSITIPANCTLKFDGGSISGGTLQGTNTKIEAGIEKIFLTDIILSGTWDVDEAYVEWFGAKGDGVTDDYLAIKKCIDSFDNISLLGKKYYVDCNGIAQLFYVKNIKDGDSNLSKSICGAKDGVYYQASNATTLLFDNIYYKDGSVTVNSSSPTVTIGGVSYSYVEETFTVPRSAVSVKTEGAVIIYSFNNEYYVANDVYATNNRAENVKFAVKTSSITQSVQIDYSVDASLFIIDNMCFSMKNIIFKNVDENKRGVCIWHVRMYDNSPRYYWSHNRGLWMDACYFYYFAKAVDAWSFRNDFKRCTANYCGIGFRSKGLVIHQAEGESLTTTNKYTSCSCNHCTTGFYMASSVYSSYVNCGADNNDLGYYFDNCRSISLNACGQELNDRLFEFVNSTAILVDSCYLLVTRKGNVIDAKNNIILKKSDYILFKNTTFGLSGTFDDDKSAGLVPPIFAFGEASNSWGKVQVVLDYCQVTGGSGITSSWDFVENIIGEDGKSKAVVKNSRQRIYTEYGDNPSPIKFGLQNGTGAEIYNTRVGQKNYLINGKWVTPDGYSARKRHGGRVERTKLLTVGSTGNDVGYPFFDVELRRILFWNGGYYKDSNGFTAVNNRGTTAQRPLSRVQIQEGPTSTKPTNGKRIYVGYTYHDTTENNYQIANAIADDGTVTWVNETTKCDHVPVDAPRRGTTAQRDEITAEYAYNNLYVGFEYWNTDFTWPTYISTLERWGDGTISKPYRYYIEWSSRQYHTDCLSTNDIGFAYFDTDLGKNVYAKSIYGNITWIEEDGAKAGVIRTGTTAQRPVGSDIYIGFRYFDTDLGKTIYASALVPSYPYTVTWVDTDGNKADSRKLGLVTQRPALSDIVTGFAYIVTQDFTATIEDPISGEPGETVSCKAGVYTYILPIQSWATPMGSIIADSDFPSRT